MSVVIRLKVPIEMHYTVIPMGTSKVNSSQIINYIPIIFVNVRHSYFYVSFFICLLFLLRSHIEHRITNQGVVLSLGLFHCWAVPIELYRIEYSLELSLSTRAI